jgi:hypothetical protein
LDEQGRYNGTGLVCLALSGWFLVRGPRREEENPIDRFGAFISAHGYGQTSLRRDWQFATDTISGRK